MNPVSAEETLIDKFNECKIMKSDKLISPESIGLEEISDQSLNNFWYRRTKEHPGLEFISNNLVELTIDKKDFKKHARAYAAWDNDLQAFSDHDYDRLRLSRGEEDFNFSEQLSDPDFYWLQDQ